jgi:peptide/nickel transport system permease protein
LTLPERHDRLYQAHLEISPASFQFNFLFSNTGKMVAYIVRRLIQSVFVIILVTFLVFIIIRLLPGDPVLIYLSQEEQQLLTAEEIATVRHDYGLDRSLPVQYITWISDVFHGDLGTSLFYREDVSSLIAQRVPVTLYLGLIAFVISHLLGIVAGTISALRRGRWLDTLVTILANMGITIPIFWLGILLIYVFGLKAGWLPRFGYTSPFVDLVQSIRQAVLPVVCLSIFPLASIARQTRSSMLEVIRQDYVRTAWSKGLKERAIVIKHVLKNGLIPVVTLTGIGLSLILGGSVLVETVFNIPGMGRLGVEAVLSQDYAIIQAIILITAMMIVTVNLLVDISYGWLDPRIRYG